MKRTALARKTPLRQVSPKPRKGVSKALRQDAKGRECTLKIPGVCSRDTEKTVGCHMRFFGFGGMGMKPDDIFIIDACSECHSALDNRAKWEAAGIGWDDVLRAFMQTLAARKAAGLIETK